MNSCKEHSSEGTSDSIEDACTTFNTDIHHCEGANRTDDGHAETTALSVPEHLSVLASYSVVSNCNYASKPPASSSTSNDALTNSSELCCCFEQPSTVTTSQDQLCCDVRDCCPVDSNAPDISSAQPDECCLAIRNPPTELPCCCPSSQAPCCLDDPSLLSENSRCSSSNMGDCCPGHTSTQSEVSPCCSKEPCCCYTAESKCCSMDTVLDGSDTMTSSSLAGTDDLEVLRSMDMSKLFDLTNVSDEQFEQWLTSVGLLPRCRVCQCGCDMRVKTWRMRRAWVCKKRCCSSTQGFYAGTFFNGVHVASKEIFRLSFYWCIGTYPIERVQQALRRPNGSTFSAKSLIDWYGFFRGVCTGYFRQNPLRLGGEGKRVLIEEIMVMQEQTRKVKRGREHWGFAGTEQDSSACFIELADGGLNARSLLSVVERYVLPGTVVVSNLFNKYDSDHQLHAAFEQLAEKSRLRLVDSLNESEESGIGETWCSFKFTHNKKMDERTIPTTHIKEFMWRRLFDGGDCMYHLWAQIASNYKF